MESSVEQLFVSTRSSKGERSAEIPVEEPTKLPFIVNSKTASALGVSFPAMALARAELRSSTDKEGGSRVLPAAECHRHA
jgi:hypothetical protein